MKYFFFSLLLLLLSPCLPDSLRAQDFPEDIRPLILTRWGQHHPFNLLCPKTERPDGTAVSMPAGCGPVAMAQVVNYYHYPSESPDGTYQYEWGLMYPTLSPGLRKEELVAVAKLISDCGVSALTDYGEKASGTSLSRMMGAMKRLMSYSDFMCIYERADFSTPRRDSLFRRLIFDELKAGRPVLYRGYSEKEKNGHLFIIDGCRKRKVHVNMGWAGHRDGYYELDDLAGYSQQQWLLIDVADSTYRPATKDVSLDEAGTLGTLLSEEERLTTRHIRLSGRMDGRDFATLRHMMRDGLLRTVDMEDVELEELPDSAFYECSYLSHVVAPRTLRRTGDFAFGRCRNLGRVCFHDGLQAVSNGTFSGCTNLLTVSLPASVTYVGYNAFTSCEALLSVTLPEGVQRVGNYAFSYCQHLYSVNLPATLESFGKGVFKECPRLRHVRLDPANTHFTTNDAGELVPRQP